MIGEIKKLLILPHIHVHNANALSSPFTIGFPAMTAWLGATHALQRKLNENNKAISFDATGVVSHQCDVQSHKGSGDFVSSIISTGNPLDKSGSRPAFIEEARCHLDVSLLIEVSGLDKDLEETFLQQVSHILNARMKMAGGDIKTFNPPGFLTVEDGNDKDMAKLKRMLMPGYALLERRDLMVDAMQQGQDATAALLDYLAIHHHCEKNENDDVSWHSKRKVFQDKPVGWVVPIATGFHGISEIGAAKNQRDAETPHGFAESVVTLGEFKMPYRLKNAEALLWRYHYDEKNKLYLCQQGRVVSNTDSSFNQDSISSEFE